MPGAHSTVETAWTGDVLYVLGSGLSEPPPDEDAGPAQEEAPPFLAYIPADDAWVERPDPLGGARRNHDLTWTGVELVVWGGEADQDTVPGLRWEPPS